MKYFVLDNEGNSYGPYNVEELNNLVNEKRVIENTVLLNSDTQEKILAKDILQFQYQNTAPPKMPPSQMSSQVPYQIPNANYYANQPKNNHLALTIISFILIIFFPLAGIITSAIGLSKAKKDGEDKTTFTIALILNIIAVVFQLIIIIVMIPFLSQTRNGSKEIANLSKMKQIGTAMIMYSVDYDNCLPSSENWKTVLEPYVYKKEVFECIPENKHQTSFAMNDFYSFVNLENTKKPASEFLAFEAPFGVTHGDEAQVYTAKERIKVLYCDGHAGIYPSVNVRQEIVNTKHLYLYKSNSTY